MKNNKKSILGTYRGCWKYLKQNNLYFWIVSSIFLASILLGFIFPIFFTEYIEKIITELIAKTEGMNFIQLFGFIFQNNLKSSFIGMVSGILLGILPLIMIFFNGYLLGFIANRVTQVYSFTVLWRLLPHGVFEIPAIIISLGLGVRIGISLFSRDIKKIKKDLLYHIENSLRVFLFIILPLLLIAALIEAAFMIFVG